MAIITASDWTPVENKMRSVLSTPDGTTNDLGYNTAYSRGAVASGNTVTGAQWNALRADVNKAYALQTGANSDLTTRDSTAIITATDLATISARVDTAYNTRGSVSTGQLTYLTGPSYSTTGAWSGTLTPFANVSITWADNNAFRGFWNGGGRIVFRGSRSGGDATSQNQSWSNLLSNMGNIILTRTGMFQSGQSWNGTFYNSFDTGGEYGTSNTGDSEAFRIYGQDTSYTANYVQIYLRTDNANVKLRTSISLYMYFADDHGALGAGPDYINGTTTANVDIYYPFAETKPNNY